MRAMSALLFLSALGCAEKGPYDEILGLDADADAGATVYSSSCAACHGADGEGVTGPAMTEVAPEHHEEDFLDAVFGGVGEDMPAFTLSDQEAADLVLYCHTSFGGFGSEEHDH